MSKRRSLMEMTVDLNEKNLAKNASLTAGISEKTAMAMKLRRVPMADRGPRRLKIDPLEFANRIGFKDYKRLLDKISLCDPEDAKAHFRNLCRGDLYFLIRYGMNRPDIEREWLFDRCREVQAAPDGYIDLWAREAYKALSINTPIWTTKGWKNHGDLAVGDKVFSPEGKLVRVLANTGRMDDADCYAVGNIIAAGDHRWPHQKKIRTRTGDWREGNRVVSYQTEVVDTRTKEIRLHHIKPLEGSGNLPIDPYVMGAWLGDGHSASNRITCAYSDLQVIAEVARYYKIKEHRSSNLNTGLFIFGAGVRGKKGTGIFPVFRALGLYNNKHIPDIYLKAKPEDRLALLQGLMDTDGHCNTRGRATFTNSTELLIDGFLQLARSLGLRATKGVYPGYWQVSFQAYKATPPFRLQRKLERCKVGEPVMKTYRPERTKSVTVNCIQVEGGQYLAGEELLPTCNSTIITVGKTLQDIFRSHGEDAPVKKEQTFCIFSHTRPIAKGFLRQIKREAESNPRFKEWFPDVVWENPSSQAPTWSEDSGLIFRRESNPKEATVEAWGLVDGQPTSKHFDVLLYDDIVTSKSVYTPEMIHKTTRELELSYNLGAQGGCRRFIGTRYSFGDSYRTIIERGTAIPRIYPATEDGTVAGKPVLLTRDELAEKRRDMGSYTFSCQMLQNPVADSAQKFIHHWLSYHEPETYRGEGHHNYIIVDPAHSKKKTSDYTVMLVLQARADKKLYLMDGLRDRMSLTERAQNLVELHKKWKPMIENGVRYERYGAQADIEHIQDYMARTGYRFEITEVGGKIGKTERILRLVPYFQNGRLLIPYSLVKSDYEGNQVDLIKVFVEEEYLAFPHCVHDDILDCLARAADPLLPLVYPEDALYNEKHAAGHSGSRLQDMDMEDFLL